MKRPLLLALTGLITGILSGFNDGMFLTVSLCIVTIAFPALFLCRYFKSTSILLPLFFIMGLIVSENACYNSPAFSHFEENGIPVCIEGTLIQCNENYKGYTYKLKVENYSTAENPLKSQTKENINLKWNCDEMLSVGTKIRTEGYILNLYNRKNPTDFNNYTYYKPRGYDFSFHDKAYNVIGLEYNLLSYFNDIKYKMMECFDNSFTQENASILKAVILGDKSDLSLSIQDSYREIGIYHFLAISGLHISVLAGSFFFILRRINYSFAAFISICFLGIYCCITGFSIPILRASVMTLIYVLSIPFNRRYDLISSACSASILFLGFQPLYIYDYGFQYSFGAIFGIGFVADIFRQYKNRWQNLISALGAGIAIKPLTYLYSYKINIIDILINILLIPVMSLIVILGFSVALASTINTDLSTATAFILMPVLNCFKALCKIIESFPFCNYLIGVPDIKEIIILYTGIFATYWLLKNRSLLLNIAVLCLSIGICISLHLKNKVEFQADFLYIGEGDCTIVRKGDTAILIDTGGNIDNEINRDCGRYTILPYLNYCGIDKLKAVFISHSDADHIKNLLDITGNIPIENIYVSKVMEDNSYYRKMLETADLNNIPITSLGTGDKLNFNNINIDVFSPNINSKDTSNNNSLVFKLVYKDLSILFTGDIDSTIEKRLIEKYNLTADILKVAHHGSKYSSCIEFLKAVNPKFSIISVGENNWYDHPHKETTDRFQQSDLEYGTTDKMGMISVIKEENGYSIKNYVSIN